jgi:CBS domain containing-hemolysin-like protein
MVNQERGIVMFAHSVLLGFVIYFAMVVIFKQPKEVAEDRSLLIAAFIMIYMILFGHGAPTSVNKNISFF